MTDADTSAGPTLDDIRLMRRRLGEHVLTTPVRRWDDAAAGHPPTAEAAVFLKEELFQRTGSFKPRGALAVMLDLAPAARQRGVTAVSAGNHAMAVAYAARILDTSAKVVMPAISDPFRVEASRRMGADVELVDGMHRAFTRVREI